jgi:TonB family protein
MNPIYKTILICTFSIAFNISALAQTGREKGIEFYKNGNYAEAIRYLERTAAQKAFQKDGEIWNYIGLSYINQNKEKDARKAFEKAVKYAPQSSVYRANLAYAYLLNEKTDKAQSAISKAIQLDPKNANAYYIRGISNLWEDKAERAVADAERAIAFDPKFAAAYVLHSEGLLTSFGNKWAENTNPREHLPILERAAESLNKCLSDCTKDNSLKVVTEKADTVNAFLDYFKKTKDANGMPDTANENITPLNITYKPKPKYTDAARQANETGNIRIAMMFGADGQMKHPMVIKGLRYGLNEQALNAAKGVRFEPQKIDGKPVSVVKVMVFTFTIY